MVSTTRIDLREEVIGGEREKKKWGGRGGNDERNIEECWLSKFPGLRPKAIAPWFQKLGRAETGFANKGEPEMWVQYSPVGGRAKREGKSRQGGVEEGG